MTRKIRVLHGPNLNLLGSRESDTCGRTTLAEIDAELAEIDARSGVDVASFQSNHEGELVERIHAAATAGVAFIVINPAVFTHTREPFRHHSHFSDIARGVVVGLGRAGYRYALDYSIGALPEATAD